jgi:hypothetical protein
MRDQTIIETNLRINWQPLLIHSSYLSSNRVNPSIFVDHAIRKGKRKKKEKENSETKGISHKNAFRVEDDIQVPLNRNDINDKKKGSRNPQGCDVQWEQTFDSRRLLN